MGSNVSPAEGTSAMLATSDWIVIGCIAFIALLLIIIMIINIKIMSSYKKELRSTRVGRVVTRIEVIDGWVCIVAENRGQELASNVKLNCKGSLMSYYYGYIKKCRVDDVFGMTLGKKFTLVAGDRKQVGLFPIYNKGEAEPDINVTANKVEKPGKKDVDFSAKAGSDDFVDIDEVVDAEDADIFKKATKAEEKQIKADAKAQAKLDKKEAKRLEKEQKKIQKENKKKRKATHTSVIEQPDTSKIMKKADITMNVEYESLGYLMKNKYVFNNLCLNTMPNELKTMKSVISAQNALLSQVVILQNKVRELLGDKEYPSDNDVE